MLKRKILSRLLEWKFWTGKEVLAETLSIGCIPTISAAGSETSASAVLTMSAAGERRGSGSVRRRTLFVGMP